MFYRRSQRLPHPLTNNLFGWVFFHLKKIEESNMINKSEKLVKIRFNHANGDLTIGIPSDLRNQLPDADLFETEITDEGIVHRPLRIYPAAAATKPRAAEQARTVEACV